MNFIENLYRNEEAIEVYMKKGNSQTNLFQFKESIIMYDLAIKSNSQYVHVYMREGNSLQNLLMHEEAIQIYDKAIQLEPQQLKAYIKKGYSYMIYYWNFSKEFQQN